MSLKVGDLVPYFELKDQKGELFKSNSVIGQKPAVVYFYPKDETPGCTAEACSFRDSYDLPTSSITKVIRFIYNPKRILGNLNRR
jgi:peroxiredoxin